MNDTTTTAAIDPDRAAPLTRVTRGCAATPARLSRAHTDLEPSVRWADVDRGRAKLPTLLAAGEIPETVKAAQA
ncbi:hypothetical protein [Lapillicoccus sp.]|uniref:hypothetical protein n=1 Tax=Lapillicoccus sp. TaxID=1909287 RepID=UPI0032670854